MKRKREREEESEQQKPDFTRICFMHRLLVCVCVCVNSLLPPLTVRPLLSLNVRNIGYPVVTAGDKDLTVRFYPPTGVTPLFRGDNLTTARSQFSTSLKPHRFHIQPRIPPHFSHSKLILWLYRSHHKTSLFNTVFSTECVFSTNTSLPHCCRLKM